MSEVEKLIERVVSESGKSEEEVRSMMEKRKEATHGLLSDYGAIYAVAKELSVGFNGEKTVITPLSDVALQKAFNVVGRVKAVYPPKTFDRKDGSKGRIASIFLADNSGERRLTLWDTNADLALKVSKGDLLFAKNVYGKPGRESDVELHATSLSNIEVNPKMEADVPKIKDAKVKIKKLKADLASVDVVCRISAYYPPKEFNRSDGSTGLRASFTGEDDTGKIRVVLWDEAAKTALSNGDIVRLENAYTREGMNKEIELQVGNNGRIMLAEEKLKLPPAEKEKETRIVDIKPGMQNLSVVGRAIQVFKPKQYSKGTMSSFVMGDGTGAIRVVLWDEKADIGNELKKGDAVKLRNAYSRQRQDGEAEVHAGKYSEVTMNSELDLPPIKDIEKSLVKEKNIIELENNDRYVLIRGNVVDIRDRGRPVYTTCPYCNKKVQNQGLGYFCESCSQEVDPMPNLIISLTVEDDTGSVRAIAFKETAEKILDMDVEEVMNLIGELQDESAPVSQAKERLLNQPIALIGRVRYSDFSDQLEFIVEDVV